jgi:bifunctional NMN adenylyltransferase/nudix hydrolase
MEKEFDLLVFIGRFQPFHVEHKRIIDTALQKSKYVLVLVGSAGKPRTVRNPFTFDERRAMIEQSFSWNDTFNVDAPARLIIKPLYDKTYNDVAWINQVQTVVKETVLDAVNGFNTWRASGHNDARVGLIGMAKDHTSYYLKMFPQFESVDVPMTQVMHATAIREGFLAGTFQKHELHTNELPENVAKFMFDEFKLSDQYMQLRNELEHVKSYKKAWEAAPYPVKHITVDAVVEQSGHVLVVKRRAEPGKGLWALPGGHLEEFETLDDGVIRELREETKIKVPDPVLRGSIHSTHMFDDPHRSNIGRVITYAAHIKLAGDTKLPKVKGADDAEKAVWLPIGEVREDMFFDDHFHIITYFLGL